MSAALLSLRFRSELSWYTPLMESVAGVVGELFDAGALPTVHAIREACFARGVESPTHGANGRVSYGTVDRVLRVLRRAGALQWASAYVRRWHFADTPEPGQPRPAFDHAKNVWRLPARILALGASWIERHQAPEAGREATQEASAHGRAPDVSSLPIQQAQGADELSAESRRELQQRWGWKSP